MQHRKWTLHPKEAAKFYSKGNRNDYFSINLFWLRFIHLHENDLANDFVFFRYADVLLMKAEALMRKNGGSLRRKPLTL